MAKKWREAEVEYLAALDQHPDTIQSYIEAADFFADRKDVVNLELVLAGASHSGFRDPRLEFYRAVVLVLRRTELSTAEASLRTYLTSVPERSDYPSHRAALTWLAAAQK